MLRGARGLDWRRPRRMRADRWRRKEEEKEGRIPAEDESNNFDMTLPRSNLASLWDKVSSLWADSYKDSDVITLFLQDELQILIHRKCNLVSWKVFKHRPVNSEFYTRLWGRILRIETSWSDVCCVLRRLINASLTSLRKWNVASYVPWYLHFFDCFAQPFFV